MNNIENIYEEEYPTSVSYDKYESDIQELEQQITSLQDENFKLICEKETLEEQIKDLNDRIREYEEKEKNND